MICTGVAPEAVFTVRTYGDTGQLYGLGLVRKLAQHNPQTRSSTSVQAPGRRACHKSGERQRARGPSVGASAQLPSVPPRAAAGGG